VNTPVNQFINKITICPIQSAKQLATGHGCSSRTATQLLTKLLKDLEQLHCCSMENSYMTAQEKQLHSCYSRIAS